MQRYQKAMLSDAVRPKQNLQNQTALRQYNFKVLQCVTAASNMLIAAK
jgi:hypothetical protein